MPRHRDTRFPLPEDAETSYNYAGWTYWDSTRGLRLGVRDDFLHWVIVWTLIAAVVTIVFTLGPALLLTSCT